MNHDFVYYFIKKAFYKHCVGLMPEMESSDINRGGGGGNCCFVVMTGCTATNKRGNRNFVELEVGSGRCRRRRCCSGRRSLI